MENNYLPLFRPGTTVTFTASAAVKAGDLVEVGSVDWSIRPAADVSATVLGVAGHSAAQGEQVTVELGRTIHELVASATINRGARVVPAGGGKVKTASAEASPTTLFGIALASAAANAAVPVVQA